MSKAIIIALALFLGACGLTSEGDIIRDAIKCRGSNIAAEGLKNATWFICKAAPIGSVQEEFGKTSASAKVYRDFCFREGNGQVVGPE